MKRSVRMVALFLSFLMLVPLFSVSALGAIEEKVYVEENFDSMEKGSALVGGEVLYRVPVYATVEEEAEENRFASVPFRGRVSARTDYEGNPDQSIIFKNSAASWKDGAMVLSIDYYLHYVELAKEDCGYSYTSSQENPTVECQFSSITYGETGTQESFISLFVIDVKTGKLTNTGTPVENAGVLLQDAWNTVKLIIDPVSGTYKTYLNGSLHSTHGYISRANNDAGIRNVEIPIAALIALKCNKNVGAYNANTSYEDITSVSIDNVYFGRYTETVTVTLDGEEIEVIKDTPLILKKDGYTLDYVEVTPKEGSSYVATSSVLNVEDGMTIRCHWLEGDYFGYHSFDRLQTNASLSVTQGFAEVPPHSTVLSEGTGDRINGFVRVPFVGTESASSTSNWDKSIQVNHEALTSGDSFTVEAKYRYHYEGSSGANPTVEAQMYQYTFTSPEGIVKPNGVYLNLYIIDLASGIISNCGTVVENAPRLKADEWNTVRMVFYPGTASFKLYLNDALYSVQNNLPCVVFSPVYEYYTEGCSNLKIAENQFIVAKCNKNSGAYVSESNADRANYIDVDDVRVFATPKAQITVDGEALSVGEGQEYSLVGHGEQLLWADVTKPGETTERIYTDRVTAVDGLRVETVKLQIQSTRSAELRMTAPDGVRFTTVLGSTSFEALLANDEVEGVEIGTLIVPTLSLASLNAFTHATLDAQGISHLDVKGTVGKWYSVSDTEYRFAGSIAYVKERNYNLSLSALGYVRVKTTDGKCYTVYAETESKNVTETTFAGEAKLLLENGMLTEEEKAHVKVFADAYVGDMLALYKKDLAGLNVLAFGDSLFGGTSGYPQSTQWVNKLGLDCSWNLTNLGISSMTVSHTKYNNDPTRGNKNSMYDWLFNGKNDFRWNSNATPVGTNPYFKTGECTDDKSDVELIILEGGCNDYGTAISAPLGTVDSRDPATFLGAWNLITEKLLADYPNATIVFLTTWRMGPQLRENDTLTSIEFSESVITLYEEKYAENGRIALINAGDPAVSGVDMLDSTWKNTYSTDSYHLKDTGMAVMAEHMLPLLWNIVRKSRVEN